MLKTKFEKVICLIIISLISCIIKPTQAAIVQNPKLTQMDDGFLEVKPNGSLVLRGSWANSSNIWQEAIIFKTILNAIRLMPLQSKNTLNDINQKIYGDGVEHKFPPFLERVIQRIQTYFSVYKYTDTSKPQRVENKPITTVTATTSETALNLNDNIEIDVNLTSASTNSYNRFNKTTTTIPIATTTSISSVNKYTKPLKISTTTTTTMSPLAETPIVLIDDADEENEFIEIKSNKLNNNNNKKS